MTSNKSNKMFKFVHKFSDNYTVKKEMYVGAHKVEFLLNSSKEKEMSAFTVRIRLIKEDFESRELK